MPRNPLTKAILILLLLAQSVATLGSLPASADPIRAPPVEVELIAEHRSIQANEPFFLGFRMRTDPGWHVYWKYAGDSGSAPKFSWSVSGDDRADQSLSTANTPISPIIHWAYPERIPVGPLLNYGYSGESLFIAEFPSTTLSVAQAESSTSLEVFVDVEWLVCMEECIPGNAVLQTTLPISSSKPEVNQQWKDLFAHTRSRWPVQASEISVSGHFDNNEYIVSVELPKFALDAGKAPPLPSAHNELELTFIPDVGDIIENASPQKLHFDGKLHSLTLTRNIISDAPSEQLSGLLISNRGWTTPGLPQALEVSFPVSGVEATPKKQSNNTFQGIQRAPSETSDQVSFPMALVLAFLGGLILNIMPCVFPVLSLKLLSFAEEAGRTTRHTLTQGFLFSAGVIGTFLLLAATLILLRNAGHSLGWGFQLQSPVFVLALSFLMTALALNLLGVFEMGASVQRAFGTVKTGEGTAGSIGSGALAVVLATPCTAPFMGSALAYALTVPALSGLTVFAALGVGMALPYFLLCTVPGFLKILPRPGAWMLTFKQLMAFPLFATVIWLLWVLGVQAGPDAIVGALIGLLGLGLGLWCLGIWAAPHRRYRTRMFGRLACAACALVGGWLSYSTLMESRPVQSTTSGVYTDTYGQQWEDFSEKHLSELLASKRVVYLDFTAAWCITCQVNKKLVFSSSEVRDFISSNNIALIRADWTNQDPSITEALAKFGRQGVPLNVVFPHSQDSSPDNNFTLLPAVLTPNIVLEALRQAVK